MILLTDYKRSKKTQPKQKSSTYWRRCTNSKHSNAIKYFIQWPETTQTYNYWSEVQWVTRKEESRPSVYSDYYNNYIRSWIKKANN